MMKYYFALLFCGFVLTSNLKAQNNEIITNAQFLTTLARKYDLDRKPVKVILVYNLFKDCEKSMTSSDKAMIKKCYDFFDSLKQSREDYRTLNITLSMFNEPKQHIPVGTQQSQSSRTTTQNKNLQDHDSIKTQPKKKPIDVNDY